MTGRRDALASVDAADFRERAPAGTVEAAVKTVLVVLLVVLVVLTGLPIPMAMGMSGVAACQDCGPAVLVAACTLAVLAAAAALALILLSTLVRTPPHSFVRLLHSFVLERPPRLV